MSLEKILLNRANNACELCSATQNLNVHQLDHIHSDQEQDKHIVICELCTQEIKTIQSTNLNHWRCLNDSMWSEHSPVKVMTYRILSRYKDHGWPADLLNMIYLSDQELQWANAEQDLAEDDKPIVHRDANGAILQNGDNVVIIKDLNVKGTSMVVKRGTAVRNVKLVWDNPEQLEGKIEGQQIVILTQYVKK